MKNFTLIFTVHSVNSSFRYKWNCRDNQDLVEAAFKSLVNNKEKCMYWLAFTVSGPSRQLYQLNYHFKDLPKIFSPSLRPYCVRIVHRIVIVSWPGISVSFLDGRMSTDGRTWCRRFRAQDSHPWRLRVFLGVLLHVVHTCDILEYCWVYDARQDHSWVYEAVWLAYYMRDKRSARNQLHTLVIWFHEAGSCC